MLWVVGAPARLFVARALASSAWWRSSWPPPTPSGCDRLTNFADPFKDFHGAGWQAGPRPLRAVQRRLVRPGHRRQPAEVGRPARGAHRLHLRRARRGARPGRHAAGARPVPHHRLRRASGSRISTEDPFVRYVSAGITIWLIGQMIINVGMVLALLPVIGIPLPLVSYGGSALVPSLVALGLLSASPAASPRPRAALRRSAARGRSRRALRRPGARPRSLDREAASMRVLLAGGGTAGHTSPLLATADALRRLDPDVEITCLGTAARPGDPGGARGRLPARADPAGPAAAPAQRRPARGARPAARRGQGRARGDRPGPARRGRRLRRLRLGAGLPRRPPPHGCRSSSTRATPCPGSPTSSAPGSPRHVATSFPDTAAAARATYVGLPIRRMISHPRPGRAARRGPRVLRPRPRPADAAGHRRLPGRPPAQPGASPAPRRALAAAGVQVLHVVGPEGRGRARADDRRPAVRRACRSSTGWTSPTPPPTSCVCRAGANTVTEVAGVGLPAIFVPLPIGNGEQALNARPVVDAGGGLLVADAALTPEWVRRAPCPPCSPTPSGSRAMGAAAAGADPARRRRASWPGWSLDAGRGRADEGPGPRRAPARRPSSAGCTSSASAAPACPASPGSCWPAASPVTGSDANDSPHARGAARARRRVPPRPRRRPRRRRRHASSSRPRCARTTPRCVEARAPGPAAAAALGRPRSR